MHSTQIILAPVVTEKSSRNQEQNKYTFRVHSDANKIQVQQAIEQAYGVKVDSVRILKVQRKTRLVGRGKERTKRQACKKAIVTLKEGTLDVNKVKMAK